jgi:Tol biopolymer transport system component
MTRPKALTVLRVLFAGILLFFMTGCQDKEEADPSMPTGWQPVMHGKLIYSQNSFTDDEWITWMDASGAGIVGIDGTRVYGVSWSPDGQQIVYSTNDGVHIAREDGSMDTLVVDNYENDAYLGHYGPVWSPAGQSIAYCCGLQVHVLDLESGEVTEYNAGPIQDTRPNIDWSPDARYITYDILVPYINGVQYIGVVDLEEGGWSGLTDDDDYSSAAAWSPDGSTIAFANPQVCLMDAGGTAIAEITTFAGDDLQILHIAWSPDGNYLALGTSQGIYVIDLEGNIVTHLRSGFWCYSIDWVAT